MDPKDKIINTKKNKKKKYQMKRKEAVDFVNDLQNNGLVKLTTQIVV